VPRPRGLAHQQESVDQLQALAALEHTEVDQLYVKELIRAGGLCLYNHGEIVHERR
jgi:hypothetical protein